MRMVDDCLPGVGIRKVLIHTSFVLFGFEREQRGREVVGGGIGVFNINF